MTQLRGVLRTFIMIKFPRWFSDQNSDYFQRQFVRNPIVQILSCLYWWMLRWDQTEDMSLSTPHTTAIYNSERFQQNLRRNQRMWALQHNAPDRHSTLGPVWPSLTAASLLAPTSARQAGASWCRWTAIWAIRKRHTWLQMIPSDLHTLKQRAKSILPAS